MLFIPNTNKIMITGGYSDDYLDSTEILDTEGGSVTMASPMKIWPWYGCCYNQWRK